MKTTLIVSLLLLTGCTTADLTTSRPMTPQQQAAMMALGSQLMAGPTPPRIVNCQSRPQGIYVNTTCY